MKPVKRERTLRALYKTRDDFVLRLVNLHAEAHRIGLPITGHALHAAVQKVGYELADQITAARKGRRNNG